jgi:hypothetical protein
VHLVVNNPIHKRRPTVIALVVMQAIAIAQVDSLQAQTCSLNGRQIEFNGKLCVRGNCSIIHHKLRFLGEKILLYPNVSKDEGTVFQLGRPTELKDASSGWHASGPPGSTELSVASAEQHGSHVILTIDHRWTQAGEIVGHGWRTIEIESPNCASCDLILYEFNFDHTKGPGFRSTFEKYSCHVLD